MAPARHLAAFVEAGFDPFHRYVEEAVSNIVFARPFDLYGRAGFLGEERGFDGVVALRLAAEAAAEQRDVSR